MNISTPASFMNFKSLISNALGARACPDACIFIKNKKDYTFGFTMIC
jgi:hypothetical protein